jgi:hypothetical protein
MLLHFAEKIVYSLLAFIIVTSASLAVGRFRCTIVRSQVGELVSVQVQFPYPGLALACFVALSVLAVWLLKKLW